VLNIHAGLYVAINISHKVFESQHLIGIIVVLLSRTGEVNIWFNDQAASWTFEEPECNSQWEQMVLVS
jgi:hypothetical protein